MGWGCEYKESHERERLTKMKEDKGKVGSMRRSTGKGHIGV